MKFRCDFVTNSSSSSFIVNFKDKDAMKEAYDSMCERYAESIAERVFSDIEEGKCTYSKALASVKESLTWKIKWRMEDLPEHKYKPYTYFESPEFMKLVNREVNKRLEEFKAKTAHRGIFAEVSYSDHSEIGSFLETKVMPEMPFVKYISNNH